MVLNSATAPPALLVGRVLVVRREEAEGVVAPVVSQPEIEQPVVVQELVHRHQLDRRHVQRLQVVDDHRVRQPGVGAALFLGDAGMGLGHALDVRLVDDRLVVRACSGARSEPQLKNGLITTLVMVWPSESTRGGVPP